MNFNTCIISTVQDLCNAEKSAIQNGQDKDLLCLKAGYKVAARINEKYFQKYAVILAGPGSNGKDGLYTGFFLQEMGWQIVVLTFYWSTDRTAAHYELAKKLGLRLEVFKLGQSQQYFETYKNVIFIDAIFGIGLNKPVPSDLGAFMHKINEVNPPIVAIDIPSGINADTGDIMGSTFNAVETITFTTAKIGHFLMPAKKHVGRLSIVQIGVAAYINPSQHIYQNHPVLWQKFLPTIKPDDHKYNRGVVNIVSGQMTGAVRLAAKAAKRSGVGLVKIATHEKDRLIYAIDDPENIIIRLEDFLNSLILNNLNQPASQHYRESLLIGCGFRAEKDNQHQVLALLNSNRLMDNRWRGFDVF